VRRAETIVRLVFAKQLLGILRTTAGIVLYMVGFYVPFVYLATGLQTRGILSLTGALSVTTGALVGLAVLSPAAGWLADKIGVRRLLISSALPLGIISVPLFAWMQHGRLSAVVISMTLLVFIYAPTIAVAPLPLALQFPQAVRGTAFSVGFNLAATLCGGRSPLVADLLVQRTGSLAAAGGMLLVAVAPSVWAWASCPAPSEDSD